MTWTNRWEDCDPEERRKKNEEIKVNKVRRIMRKHLMKKDPGNDGRSRDATSVSVPSEPDPTEKSSNEIHVGGIADFHEQIVKIALLLM